MKYIYFTILICFSTYISSTAQKVGIDPSFQPKGPFLGTIDKMALQADGKILIIGNFTKYDGIEVGGIARLHSNGQLDTSFKTGLGFFVKINQLPNCIHIQNDGKILIGGRFNRYNTTYAINIVRLNQDGTADTNFNATNV
ncbi:MAG: delta-60 repeat domain-containing protein [Bacteroidia bacterium]